MKDEKRNKKRFNLRNALIRFPGKDISTGRVVDISVEGIKMQANREFKEGETINAEINLGDISTNLEAALAKRLAKGNMEIKVKVVWKDSDSVEHGMKNIYGVAFDELDETGKKVMYSILESLGAKKISGEKTKDILKDIEKCFEKYKKA